MEIQWALVFFTLLAGAGAGLLAYAGVSEFLGSSPKVRFVSSVTAFVLIAVGGCVSVLHLGQPAHVLAAAQHLGSFSGISVEMICLGVSAVLAFVYALLSRKESTTASKVIAVLSVISGLFFAFALGNGYVIDAREAWATIMLPFAYIGTNIAAGALIFALIEVVLKDTTDNVTLWVLIGVGSLLGVLGVAGYALAKGGYMNDGVVALAISLLCGVAAGVVGLMIWLKPAYRTNMTAVIVGACGALGCSLSMRILMWLVGSGTLDVFGAATSVISIV